VKIKKLEDGRWEFDSGEIQCKRIRRVFETSCEAEAFLAKAKVMAKDEGQKTLIEWLSFTPNEVAEIIR
jgi:hypothetical protein